MPATEEEEFVVVEEEASTIETAVKPTASTEIGTAIKPEATEIGTAAKPASTAVKLEITTPVRTEAASAIETTAPTCIHG